MKPRPHKLRLIALALAVVALGAAPRAGFIVLGITEGPDPIDIVLGRAGIQQPQPINPGGDARGDGRLDLALDPTTRLPVGVWAWNNGPDADVAYRAWLGETWGPVEFVTSSPLDEVDPRVDVDAAGGLHVVWWVDEAQGKVLYAHRAPGARAWSAPQWIVSAGRRPAVLALDGAVLVAFERRVPQRGAQIWLHTRPVGGGPGTTELLVETGHDGDLDAMLHRAGDRVWMDWRHSATLYGYSELVSGTWQAPNGELPWSRRFTEEAVGRVLQAGAGQ